MSISSRERPAVRVWRRRALNTAGEDEVGKGAGGGWRVSTYIEERNIMTVENLKNGTDLKNIRRNDKRPSSPNPEFDGLYDETVKEGPSLEHADSIGFGACL